MRMFDLIMKKRNGMELTAKEISYIIRGYVQGDIPDYQMSAFLMAVYYMGMTKEETVTLTMEMAQSGDILDLSGIKGVKVDKHSTGGIGDKTTLIVGPVVASLGICVAKMSGRGLGYTGGTIDKLESLKGFKTAMSIEEFEDNVNNIKLAVTGQTGNLAPADKKIYALRDVTATVDSIPLIASSIMSKKIASGADVIVLDVKVGSGAFMKKLEDARKLARTMVDIGDGVGRKTVAIISDMDQPLGNAVGNALEVIEAIDTLKGKGPKDLRNICIELSKYMVHYARPDISMEEAQEKVIDALDSGKALAKFEEFITAQGADPAIINDYLLLPTARIKGELVAKVSGYISGIESAEVGIASIILGAGRETKEDTIDKSVGIVLNKKINDYVKEGEVLAYIYGNDEAKVNEAIVRLNNAYTFSDTIRKEHQLVYDIIL